jgi:RNA polymerase sigma factor (sigma-70 family)
MAARAAEGRTDTQRRCMRERDFERLFAEHSEGLLAFLVYRVGERAAAEDVLADTVERVLTARRGYDPRKAKEKTWLYAIALNLVRDRARRAQAEERATRLRVRDPVVTGGAPGDWGDPFAAIDDRDAVAHAMATLSPEERDTVSLRFGADLTVPEIAKLVGEKLTTVEGRLYRALRKLRDELE